MVSVGLIGCGAVVHANYAKTLRHMDRCKVGWVADLDQEQATSTAQLFRARAADTDTVIRECDFVIVTTPPTTHASLVNSALARGKGVLCEKPFVTSAASAIDLVSTAERNGLDLFVGHFRRTFPHLRLARDLVKAGVIGSVRSISVCEGGRFTWQSKSNYVNTDPSGGVLWDTGSHSLDMAFFASCLDSDTSVAVTDVTAWRDRPEPSHDLRATFTLLTASGPVLGTCHFSRKEALPNLLEISGDRGKLVLTVGVETRVRLSTGSGTVVVSSTEPMQEDLLDFFELQLRKVLERVECDDFRAHRFVGLTKTLEAISNAA